MSNYNRKKEVEQYLLDSLKEVLNLPEEKVQKLFGALEDWVNLKVEDASNDTYDRVNKRGEWDPDY